MRAHGANYRTLSNRRVNFSSRTDYLQVLAFESLLFDDAGVGSERCLMMFAFLDSNTYKTTYAVS